MEDGDVFSEDLVKRAMKRLSEAGAIRRVGGKRFGKWEIDCEG